MNYPKNIKVADINTYHKSVNVKTTGLYKAMYQGGSKIEEYKEEILIKRSSECKFEPEAYAERLKRSFYLNKAGGIIDWITASTTVDPPVIMVSEKATDEQKQFWLGKNVDADGEGTPFKNIFRTVLRDELVTMRPYVKVGISEDNEDISIDRMDPEKVIDWGEGWVKTHAVNIVKESPFSKEYQLEHVWVIYTEEDTVVYKAYSKPQGNGELWKGAEGIFGGEEASEAVLVEEDSVHGHTYGDIPIYDGNANPSQWVMDRISQNIRALYNAESDLAWILHNTAYPQGILKLESEKRAQKVYARSEASIWNLMQGEDYALISASGTDFTAHFTNIDRLKNSLHESMQMMAKEAAAIPQAGRLSGEAVREMRSPLEALLGSFLWPVVDAFYDAINGIKEYRGEEDLGVWIEGLSTVGADDSELRKILFGEEGEEDNGRGNNDRIDERRDAEEEGAEAEENGGDRAEAE